MQTSNEKEKQAPKTIDNKIDQFNAAIDAELLFQQVGAYPRKSSS